jgi:general L-amino acid transport system substrate-binding protein
MRADRFIALGPVFALVWATLPLAQAGEVLDSVRSRGALRCGVSEGIAGFSQQDAAGRWQGLDADFCRAVAAAVLGDGEQVEFVPLRSSTRFPSLEARQIDLLVRNTTWTLAREAVLKVQFPAILFYDGQGFMVPAASGIGGLAQLKDTTVCVEKGTNHGRNLQRYSAASGLAFTPLTLDSAQAVAAAFFAGRCAAYSSDASQLAAARLSAPGGPDGYVILPERISREPLAPVVWGGDPEWTTVVRWVLYALLIAEHEGITRANAEAKTAAGEGELAWLASPDRKLTDKALVLPLRWAQRAVQAAGNYAEIYERNVGTASPLKIERGLNRLWTQGGLMYPPPVD